LLFRTDFVKESERKTRSAPLLAKVSQAPLLHHYNHQPDKGHDTMASNPNDPVPGYIEPGPKKSNTLLYVFGGIGAAVVLFCCLPCGGCWGYSAYTDSRDEKRVTSEVATAVAADDLLKNFSESAHKDKVLEITGKVNGKGLGNTLEFGTGANKVTVAPSPSENAAFEAIKVNDTVTVKGLYYMKILDSIVISHGHLVKK
jgi:hypothetical protein